MSLLLLSLLISLISSEEEEYPIIDSITEALRVNVNFNVTNNQNYSSASPNPDITIISPDYFLCIWSYIVKDEDTGNYSNEIYSNLFSSKDGRAMVRSEYLLNKIKGFSQDTPSATALFNESNHITRAVAVVWESQTVDDVTGDMIDAVYGRIIKWSITYSTGYRYVKVTSPTSKEWQISSPSIDFLHHTNPDVIPIYNTGRFLVSWISQSRDGDKNMIFIRIYENSGKPYNNMEQIQIHDIDAYYKKHPRTIPLLHNYTLLSWLAQSESNHLVIYGMIFDDEGQNKMLNSEQGRYQFQSLDDGTYNNINHTIFEDTIPVIAHLHNDPHVNNNYFIVGWQTINTETNTNTMFAAIFVYNHDTNTITQISQNKALFDKPYYSLDEYQIEYPQMENIENEIYEQEFGLDAKIALCYSLRSMALQKSDIFCKILEVTLWNDPTEEASEVLAEINLATDATRINTETLSNHRHEHPMISSESILRGQTKEITEIGEDDTIDIDNPEFVVVWSNSRQGGYDVYTRILKLNDGAYTPSSGGNGGSDDVASTLFGSEFNIIIIGVVFGIVLVVLIAVILLHFYNKHKQNAINKPRRKMHQIGEESDDEDDDDVEDTIGQNYGYGDTIVGHDDEDEDDHEHDGIQLTNQDSVTR